VFAGCLFLAAGLVYFAVIEGRGRTLEEIDTMYVMKIKPWQSSKFEFPEAGPGAREASPEKRSASHDMSEHVSHDGARPAEIAP